MTGNLCFVTWAEFLTNQEVRPVLWLMADFSFLSFFVCVISLIPTSKNEF